MESDRLLPITLPAGWTAEQDLAYLEERWDPVPSHAEALARRLDFHFDGFQAALDHCLRYFQARRLTDWRLRPRCLPPAEQIELLVDLVRRRPEVAPFRARLLEDLSACAHSERERARILREHRLAGERTWLYPLVELADYLGGAGIFLEETMRCEAPGYQALIQDLAEDEERRGPAW